jgi:hypothetical protein
MSSSGDIVEEKLINTVELKNGLQLEVLDSSRKIAGDRWQVILKLRINIPVRMLSANDDDQTDLHVGEIISSIGENVCFEQKRERNFIDENQKDDVLNNLVESFFYNSIDYVSNPDFPKRYILRQYRENLKRKSWYRN